MPIKTKTIHNNDTPWMSDKLKSGMDTITKSDLLSNLQIDDIDNLSDIKVANKIIDKFL